TSLSDDAQRAAAPPLLSALGSAAAAATCDANLPEAAVTIGGEAVADPQSPENAFVPAVVLPESLPAPQPEKRVQLATLSSLTELQEGPKPAVRPSDTPNECLVPEICIDEYLWSLYERTPKIDTN